MYKYLLHSLIAPSLTGLNHGFDLLIPNWGILVFPYDMKSFPKQGRLMTLSVQLHITSLANTVLENVCESLFFADCFYFWPPEKGF